MLLVDSEASFESNSTLCPVCPQYHPEITLTNLLISLARCLLSYSLIAIPSYKTFKAIESRKLIAAQGMLAYWCVLCFVNATKDSINEMFGKYGNFMLWKALVLAIKLAPLIISPDTLYATLIRPFYSAQEETIDSVIASAQSKKEEYQPIVEKMISEGTDQIKSAIEHSVDTIKEAMTPVLTAKNFSPRQQQHESAADSKIAQTDIDEDGIVDANTLHQRRLRMHDTQTHS